MTERGGWYETHAAEAAARYESVAAEQINAWLIDLLTKRRAVVLDVGAGSGRDTAWLTSIGHEVIATDPSAAMRAQARRWHPDLGVQYLPDRLPELTKTFRTGISFDFILVNAVWMHVAPADRKRAFRKLVTLLKPGGVIAFTLREPIVSGRDMHPVSGAEIEELARQHGAFVERNSDGADLLGRTPLRWEQVAVRVPDDGTGALPLLRHIILNDDKSSTYKLALLRVLCRIADGAAGWSVDESGGDSDRVDLPLGLVALYWIRLFKPLLTAGQNLPQMPGNVGLEGLGFVREGGFPRVMDMPDVELRAGMQIADSRRPALHRALRDARNTSTKRLSRREWPGRNRDAPSMFLAGARYSCSTGGRSTACGVETRLPERLSTLTIAFPGRLGRAAICGISCRPAATSISARSATNFQPTWR